MRVPRDKACPAVVVRSNLLTEMTHATILPITSELQPNISLRIAISRQLLKAAADRVTGHGGLAPDDRAVRQSER